MDDKTKHVKIRNIVMRPAVNGKIVYDIDEQVYLITEYIYEKKGVRPSFYPDNGMFETMLLNQAFTASLEYFADKINKNGTPTK